MESIFLPESKLNELAQRVSQRLIEAHDFDNGKIGGEALKSFSSHSQINKFLIFQVFQVWDMQINKLNHPYFNLEGEEIQETLNVLKNQISQQIEISDEDFKPMLERAIYNNLKLVLSPKEAFTSFFFVNENIPNESISLDLYQRYSQFFSDLDFVVNSILKYYQKNQFEEVDKETFFEKMDKVLEIFDKKSDKDFAAYRAEIFEKLTGFSLADVQEEVAVEQRWKEHEEAEAARKVKEETEAEEARKKAEEERIKAEEEEAKRKVEEEARKKAEEEAKKKAEEEARIKAEEEARRIAEEEARKKEAEKVSFFDTLEEKDSFFDLDLEEEVLEEETAAAAETVEEEVVEETISEAVETIADAVSAPEVEAEIVDSTPEPEVAEAEVNVESEKDFLEMAASMEPEVKVEETLAEVETIVDTVEEAPVLETPEVETPEVEAAVEEVEETVAEEIIEEVLEEVEVADEAEEEEEPTPPVVESKAQGESTVSFLDRFLNKKEASNGNVEAPAMAETEKPASVLDAVSEKPKTIAEQYSQQAQPKPLHESINGNRKIKLDEIPIHKQYQYVQKVFEGNNVRFRIIVDKVNNAKNKDEVEDILTKFVLSNDAVDTKDEVVLEFIELLRKRF